MMTREQELARLRDLLWWRLRAGAAREGVALDGVLESLDEMADRLQGDSRRVQRGEPHLARYLHQWAGSLRRYRSAMERVRWPR